MSGYALEPDAQIALDVALGTAGAAGDEHCGTEHLFFGLIATATDGVAELAELFALDTMRVERGLRLLRLHHCHPDNITDEDPPLSARAEVALHATPLGATAGLTSFDLLVAVMSDPRSGASTVLRSLGVRLGEIRRLARLGAAKLDPNEVAHLIDTLDRRSEDQHLPWWGPDAGDGALARVPLGPSERRLLARSDTAVATLDGVVAGPDGYGITVTITSCDDWVLPPRWEPSEDLIPGFGAVPRINPEVVTIDLRDGAEATISNRDPQPRFRADEPAPGSMVRLGSRQVVDERNDRRTPARRSETSEWWIWPLPQTDRLELWFEWPAEALQGVIDLDATEITSRADALRSTR
ncbi:MAG: Clp protease N-terminal domain-containing protein [Actinomycetota bacterium]